MSCFLAEYLEDSVIKPSDFHNKLDRQNLLEQAGHLLDGELEECDDSSRCHRKPGTEIL